MTKKFLFRIKVYKRYLRRLMLAKKDDAFKIKLVKPTAKEIAAYAREAARGVAFTNVARDIRTVTEPGENYDPEFDLLWRGQVVPEVLAAYSEKFLAGLVKGVVAPWGMDERLAGLSRLRPDGRRVWEEV